MQTRFLACNFTKINTPPWVFFTFFKLHKCYQIAQCITNGKLLYPTDSVKYLGIIIDKNVNWHHQISIVDAKLNRANAMLSKIRRFLNFNTLKPINHATLESHLNYSLKVWAQNANSIERLLVLQKKSLRIMPFLKRNAHTSNIFNNFIHLETSW